MLPAPGGSAVSTRGRESSGSRPTQPGIGPWNLGDAPPEMACECWCYFGARFFDSGHCRSWRSFKITMTIWTLLNIHDDLWCIIICNYIINHEAVTQDWYSTHSFHQRQHGLWRALPERLPGRLPRQTWRQVPLWLEGKVPTLIL